MSTIIPAPTVKEIKALLEFASKDEARRNLWGITVRGDGALAASDGHSAAVRGPEPRESWRGAVVVPRPGVEALLSGRKAKETIDVDHLRGLGNKDIPACPLDAVLGRGRGKPTGIFGVAPHLLARLDVVERAIGKRESATMYGWAVEQDGELDAIHTRPLFATTPWLIVIMPMRI